eukprot:INCI9245.1.p1 GENE.INCI9245.1~~INCI9245.1.p1  ORF type:complete len:245 (+),score=41.42 INCI9245.1:193-927(+)
MSIGSQAFRTVVQALRSRTSVLVNPRKEIVDVFGEKLSQEISQIKLVLPGSFNPLHKGHIGVLEEAAALQRLPRDTSIEDGLAVFEISMHNADKGVIDEEELRLRLRGFYDIGASVVITAEHPTFVSKAKLLPGRSFVVGYDTAVRIVNPQYYEGQDPQHMVAALQDIYNSGGRFLVGGRLCGSTYRCLTDDVLPLVEGLPQDLFIPIPDFRVDISSTELRAQKAIAKASASTTPPSATVATNA